jgi:endonuclease YncB( thermonuclease family)
MEDVVTYDWKIDRVVSVTDGDTLRAQISRVTAVTNDFEAVFRTKGARGVSLRLIIVDTPEVKDKERWARAKFELTDWVIKHTGERSPGLRVQTYESGGWDRLLADVYVEGDRGNTLTQYMLQRGWPPYIES